jgi:protein gp37
MSDKTAISWCDATFNPWWGCQKVSPACDHCYAERDARRFAAGQVLWGVGAERRTFGDKHWKAPLDWAKTMPAKLGRRPRVFCASMGDWLDLDAPLDAFVRLLDTVRATPELDWLLLSKRIGNWRKRLEQALARVDETEGSDSELAQWIESWLAGSAPANAWIGATVVDQAEADRDLPKLLAVPARVRFLSIEPMLGAVDVFSSITGELLHVSGNEFDPGCIDWVICGGESGPSARPMHPDWARSLRDQCAAAGVPFHFKQWGEWLGAMQDGDHEHDPVELNATDRSVRVGKKAAGRLLDGIEHNGFPA